MKSRMRAHLCQDGGCTYSVGYTKMAAVPGVWAIPRWRLYQDGGYAKMAAKPRWRLYQDCGCTKKRAVPRWRLYQDGSYTKMAAVPAVWTEDNVIQCNVTRISLPNIGLERSLKVVDQVSKQINSLSRFCKYQSWHSGANCNLHSHRKRIYTEAKAKVVASVWGANFTQFLAAL